MTSLSKREVLDRERLRQLQAAADGTYRKLAEGRYEIDGDAAPDRRVLQQLRAEWLIVPPTLGDRPVTITAEGLVELARLGEGS